MFSHANERGMIAWNVTKPKNWGTGMAGEKRSALALLAELLLRPATFVALLGILVLLLGASGGVSYKDYHLPINGAPQYLLMALGAALIIYGIYKLFQEPELGSHGIAITSP